MTALYGQRCKFLGGGTPAGGFTTAKGPFVGGCDDETLTISCGMLKAGRLWKKWSSLADKGFMMHARYAEAGHELLTPTHKWNNVPSYTGDETMKVHLIGAVRIHIERMFRRAQVSTIGTPA